jgi:radical SAM superfamily enzyme YgiQ (UPF0313 family)
MVKILVLSVPRIEPHRPPLGVSILATVCENAGHDVTLVDLNIKFFNHCKKHNFDYFNFDDIWDSYRTATDVELKFINDFINQFTIDYNLNSYNYVMLSIFGMSNHTFAEKLLEKIAPNRRYKILVGGSGAFISLKNSKQILVDNFKSRNLIDDYIRGECEESVPQYLRDGLGNGINNNNFSQITNLDSLPILSYKFLNLDEYDYLADKKSVYIEGSRGCVRSCTYCDVVAYWPKYRFRSGKHIASEIIKHYETHGIVDFYFTDSLVNGSLKAFSDMCNTLSNYNFVEKISWSGQFIFRDRRNVPPEHFEMISKAGGNTFFVGIETGSDRIRKEMGKNFTNEDIEYQLEQFHKNKLKTTFLMFPGYVTETQEDHNDTLIMLKRWQKYVANGVINGLELGSPLIFLENSPLAHMIDQYKIKFLDLKTHSSKKFWISEDNPDFNFIVRVERQLEIYEEAIKYNWPIWRLSSRVESLLNSVKSFYSNIDKNATYEKLPVIN